jgi:hypothetical protein
MVGLLASLGRWQAWGPLPGHGGGARLGGYTRAGGMAERTKATDLKTDCTVGRCRAPAGLAQLALAAVLWAVLTV